VELVKLCLSLKTVENILAENTGSIKKIFVETVVFLKIPILEIVAINGLTVDLSSAL
jgi:hypothetical protein